MTTPTEPSLKSSDFRATCEYIRILTSSDTAIFDSETFVLTTGNYIV